MKSLILSLIILSVGSSCARVPLVDSEWCADKGNFGARCNYIKAEGKGRSISKQEWDALRFGQVCTSADTFSNWKAALKKLCDEQNICYFFQDEAAQTAVAINRIIETTK